MSNTDHAEHHPIDAASKHVGGYAALAKLIEVAASAPFMWKKRGNVPPEYCASIEKATSGAVRRWHLRPEDWHAIWPELIGAEGAPAVPDSEAAAKVAA